MRPSASRIPDRLGRRGKLLLFAISFAAIMAAHWPDLHLPYFWDEAGYFVPAALDLFATGDPIPNSVAPNPHPPLATAILAGAWRLFGFHPVVTRVTALGWATLALLAVYTLGEMLGGFRVGVSAWACTFMYPVFFAQSALAQLDLPAAALTVWGIILYGRRNLAAATLLLSAAILCKESAAVAVSALFAMESVSFLRGKGALGWRTLAALGLPLLTLGLWLLYVQARTGSVFGNSEFSRYNIPSSAFVPSRLMAAVLHRVWDVFGHFFLFLLTVPAVAVFAGRRLATQPSDRFPFMLTSISVAYVFAFSFFGGAILSRYMLTAVILVITLSIHAIASRLHYWWALVPIVLCAFAVGLVTPPPYHYAYDENLMYRDVIEVHRQAAARLSNERLPIITTWPADDELSKPSLGYVSRSLDVVTLPDLSLASIREASNRCRGCAILLFPTQYEPPTSILRPGAILQHLHFWGEGQRHFETRPSTLTPEVLAAAITAQITWYSRVGRTYAAILRPSAPR